MDSVPTEPVPTEPVPTESAPTESVPHGVKALPSLLIEESLLDQGARKRRGGGLSTHPARCAGAASAEHEFIVTLPDRWGAVC